VHGMQGPFTCIWYLPLFVKPTRSA
jgi:hypothetical protein